MKFKIIVGLFLLLSGSSYSQQIDHIISVKQLESVEIDTLFSDQVRNELQINYPIYRVYEYKDDGGVYFVVMTEKEYSTPELKTSYDAIKAYCYQYSKGEYHLQWQLNDFILPEGNAVSEEYSIWFWTKYFKLYDYDKDGIVDPIMVYGTAGMNGTSDGRIKIIVYHKNKKRAIRHQNSTLDFERKTKIDASFYQLPIELQQRVQEIMTEITMNDHGIFPYEWQKAMKNRQLSIKE